MALGQEDYGIYGLIGGLTIIISFMNVLLSVSISRYYAYSIGEANRLRAIGQGDRGLEECQRWFNAALSIHTVVPVLLVLAGYPLGVYLIRHFLEIPLGKVDACVLVWNYTCISCFASMVNVPFNSMYVAKQYIAELTIYSFAQTLANVIFFYYMASHPGDWLLKYAAWMCMVAVIPQVIICVRALQVLPECKINFRFLFDVSRFKQLGSFAFWQMFGGLGAIIRNQGIAVLINKYFGARLNASFSIANQVSAHTQTLAGAMQGAFQPAIVTAFGAGDIEKARSLAVKATKFALILTLIFCLPLSIEINQVIRLWLKTPPPHSAGLCLCMIMLLLVDKASAGECLACNATGRVAAYQSIGGGLLILCLPMAWIMIVHGCGIYSVGVAIVVTALANTFNRVWFARRLLGLSIRRWFMGTIMPIGVASLCGMTSGIVAKLTLRPSFSRIIVTSFLVEIVFLPVVWICVFNSDERKYVVDTLRKLRGC